VSSNDDNVYTQAHRVVLPLLTFETFVKRDGHDRQDEPDDYVGPRAGRRRRRRRRLHVVHRRILAKPLRLRPCVQNTTPVGRPTDPVTLIVPTAKQPEAVPATATHMINQVHLLDICRYNTY